MRRGDAEPRRAARLKTTPDWTPEARGPCLRAFPREAPFPSTSESAASLVKVRLTAPVNTSRPARTHR
jgi:hypothetical protein